MNAETKKVVGVWSAHPEDPFFNGHFPGNPILPAVASVHHAFRFLKQQLEQPHLHLDEIKSAKFTHPIPPNTNVKTEACEVRPQEWHLELTDADSGRDLASLQFIIQI